VILLCRTAFSYVQQLLPLLQDDGGGPNISTRVFVCEQENWVDFREICT